MEQRKHGAEVMVHLATHPPKQYVRGAKSCRTCRYMGWENGYYCFHPNLTSFDRVTGNGRRRAQSAIEECNLHLWEKKHLIPQRLRFWDRGGTPMNKLWGKEVLIMPEFVSTGRSWRERMFSLPWRPWERTKLVRNPALEKGEIFETPGAFHISESHWEKLKQAQWFTSDDTYISGQR